MSRVPVLCAQRVAVLFGSLPHHLIRIVYPPTPFDSHVSHLTVIGSSHICSRITRVRSYSAHLSVLCDRVLHLLHRATADVQVYHVECDAAAANLKLYCFWANHRDLSSGNVMYSLVLCSNHQNHLCVVAILPLCSASLGPDMCLANQSLSSHWLRLHQGLVPFLQKELVVTYVDHRLQSDKTRASLYAQELAAFLLRNSPTYDACGSMSHRRRRALANLVEDLSQLTTFFNHNWYAGQPIMHLCRQDGSCCPGDTHAERHASAVARAASIIRRSLMRRNPGRTRCRHSLSSFARVIVHE